MAKHYYIKNNTKGKGWMLIGIILIASGIFYLELFAFISGCALLTIGKIINWWHN